MQEAIKKVMAEFNFERIHDIIQRGQIQWTWEDEEGTTGQFVPDLLRLKQAARSLLEEVAAVPSDGFVQLHGLVAEKDNGQLTLSYTLEWAGAELEAMP